MNKLFGPLLPDAAGTKRLLGPLIPDGQLPVTPIGGYGPSGDTFVLDLESGSKVTWSWVTSNIKAFGGKEQRESLLDLPKEIFDGSAILTGNMARRVRAQLAKGGATGAPFLLGLPYEELVINAVLGDNVTVSVPTTNNSDWATVVGQRVVLFAPDETYTDAVIQDSTGGTIVLDKDVSAFPFGTRIMPAVAILLEPTQGFARSPGTEATERWQLRARRAAFGYGNAAIAAHASLAASTALHNLTITSKTTGAAFNGTQLRLLALKNATVQLTGTHMNHVMTSGQAGVLGNGTTIEFDGTALFFTIPTLSGDPTGAGFVHFSTLGAMTVHTVYTACEASPWNFQFSGDSTAFVDAGDNQGPFTFSGGVGFGVEGLFAVGDLYTYYFNSFETTVQQFIDAVSTQFDVTGTFNPTDFLFAGADEITVTFLDGVDASSGTMGRGATLSVVDGDPVWDRMLQVDGTIGDSVQTMIEMIDFDGAPMAVGTADFPDWGRQVRIRSMHAVDFQWLKLFGATVVGAQRRFWLPTWRNDLEFLSGSVSGDHTLVIQNSTDTGDFFAFFPLQRQWIQILQRDGTLTYLEITVAVDNGDGTINLSGPDGVNPVHELSTSPVVMISWLERCRFESDDFEINFDGPCFTMEKDARVVQQ